MPCRISRLKQWPDIAARYEKTTTVHLVELHTAGVFQAVEPAAAPVCGAGREVPGSPSGSSPFVEPATHRCGR